MLQRTGLMGETHLLHLRGYEGQFKSHGHIYYIE